MTPPDASRVLMDRIQSRSAIVGVIGLGYVGLPLALAAVEAGFQVLGFDINPSRVAAIGAGRQVINYLDPSLMRTALDAGRFSATTDFSRLSEADAVINCVLSYVRASAASAAASLRPGQLVVLESTTWPGTTDEVVRPLLEAGGLQVGREVFLAFSPEREDPGNAHFGTRTIPKVVGADDPHSRALAVALYEAMITRVVPVSSAAAAEAVKLTENIFRSVNIALVNELKLVYDAMGIDVWEVIDAAATKPFGYMPFYPGPGLGGHCIPVDPFYLTWRAREFGMETRFIELAGQINTAMPGLVVDRLARALSDHLAQALKGARILLIGAAYKKNVDDTRESPSLVLIEAIEARGAACDFHDPLIAQIPPTREHPGLAGRRSVDLTREVLAGYDAVLIATDHDAVDYALVSDAARLVVDTRNAMARRGLPGERVVKA